MRIMALLGGIVDDPLHVNREKIGLSKVFTEIVGSRSTGRSVKILVGAGDNL